MANWNLVDAVGPVFDPGGPHGLVPMIEAAGGAIVGSLVAKKHKTLWAIVGGLGARLVAYTVTDAGVAVPGVNQPLSGYPIRYRSR